MPIIVNAVALACCCFFIYFFLFILMAIAYLCACLSVMFEGPPAPNQLNSGKSKTKKTNWYKLRIRLDTSCCLLPKSKQDIYETFRAFFFFLILFDYTNILTPHYLFGFRRIFIHYYKLNLRLHFLMQFSAL